MEIKKLSLFILSIVLLSTFAVAIVDEGNYVYEGLIKANGEQVQSSTPVNNVNVIGFICQDAECSSVSGKIWANVLSTGSDNYVVLPYPTNPAYTGNGGYGIYFYKEGYIPYEIFTDWHGYGTVGPFTNHIYKKEQCTSEIKNLELNPGNVDEGATLNAAMKVSSPINNGGVLTYIPDEIKNYYKSQVKVTFQVKQGSNVIYSESKNVNVAFSGTENVAFSWTPNYNQAGQYTVKIITDVNDNKCINSIQKQETKQLTVNNVNRAPTKPTNIVFSPSAIYVGTELTAVASGSTDADNDAIIYYYKLYNVNDSATKQDWSTNNSYIISQADAHDTIRVYTKAYDGISYSGVYNKDIVVNSVMDNIAPNINVIVPEEGKVYGVSGLTFRILTDEPAEAWFSLDSAGNVTMTAESITSFVYNVGLSNGNHAVIFYASDTAGNLGMKQISFYVNTNYDDGDEEEDDEKKEEVSRMIYVPAITSSEVSAGTAQTIELNIGEEGVNLLKVFVWIIVILSAVLIIGIIYLLIKKM